MRGEARSGIEAFSLTELVVVIAVVGILAAVAVPVMSNLVQTQQSEIARRNLNQLNGALHTYSQAVAPPTNSVDTQVMALLQTRNANVPGTPFYNSNALVVSTGDVTKFRAVWDTNTGLFRYVTPGQSGSGIDLLQLSSKAP